jgi:hypothetical protein
MEIRRGAALETPHILILIDDREDRLLPGLGQRARCSGPAYQGTLMLNSGEITGWFLDGEGDLRFLAEGLESLARSAQVRQSFLFAMGDGNHSLATAKAVWDEYKKAHTGKPGLDRHPARWALAEIENLYDPAIQFEPIHRILFNTTIDETLALLSELPGFSSRPVVDRKELVRLVGDPGAVKSRLGLASRDRYVLAESDNSGIATVGLQPLLDEFIRKAGGKKNAPSIDYIHGEEELFRLAAEAGGQGSEPAVTGILLPPVKKSGIFETVARTGPLPRKSFSMGASVEKRFYLECRKLF